MSIYINNTLKNKKEEFKPIRKGEVGIYVCGPTVYDEPHIGHVRSSLIFEVIRRYFEFKGFRVKFVKNITDIDDKIIKAAKKLESEGNIETNVKKIAQKYEDKYHEHMSMLGIRRADVEPRATEHIEDMIKMIEEIIDAGFGYVSDGNVYFSVRKYNSEYGELSGQNIEKIGDQRRLHADEAKKDALDFALWKKAKSEEPSWDSPWSEGRPGWHIECSVMSSKYLGKDFDIHCGGIDLVFPHHENEIAQAKATGGEFAHYWIHNGLLSINGEKMSKSLGNFITVEDVLDKYSSDTLNILFLSTHYSKPLNFTWDKLKEAEKSAERFSILLQNIDLILKDEENLEITQELTGDRKKFFRTIKNCKEDFNDAMDDDFNTALALSKMFDLVSATNKFLENKEFSQLDKKLIYQTKKELEVMGNVLCLFDSSEMPERDEIVNNLIELLVEVRESARGKKLFDFSDKIRDELSKLGIILEDTSEGTKYRFSHKND